MAGHLYIRNLTSNEVQQLLDAGGVFAGKIFHADVRQGGVGGAGTLRLVQQLGAGPPSKREKLPSHCYIEFAKSKTDQGKLQSVEAILARMTTPGGIVASNQNLTGWPGAGQNPASTLLWAALQKGAVTVEFYELDGVEVVIAMQECQFGYLEGLSEDLKHFDIFA